MKKTTVVDLKQTPKPSVFVTHTEYRKDISSLSDKITDSLTMIRDLQKDFQKLVVEYNENLVKINDNMAEMARLVLGNRNEIEALKNGN